VRAGKRVVSVQRKRKRMTSGAREKEEAMQAARRLGWASVKTRVIGSSRQTMAPESRVRECGSDLRRV
jgi:hypothetical protein